MRRPGPFLALLLLAGGLAVSCSELMDNVSPLTDELSMQPPAAIGNPASPEKVELGRFLFWDPILSGEKDVACATCHHPSRGYSDGRDLPLGVGAKGFGQDRHDQSGGRIPIVPRNVPTVINAAFNGVISDDVIDPVLAPMLWDNRIQSLEAQSLDPLRTRNEMRGDAYPEKAALDSVVARIAAIPEYEQLFRQAFPEPEPISAENIGKAMAVFERTIVATNSRFDQYVRGDEGALSATEKRGLFFFTRDGCYRCHSGPMFSDYKLHVLGVAENPRLSAPDSGAAGFAFRTPTLRNLSLTAPYMHNGTKATLDEVLEFYNSNSSENPHVPHDRLDEDFFTLFNIDDDTREAMKAFLHALDDPNFDRTIPARVPSGLPVGGSIQPE
jgi:cytochrome c peroxidase